MSKKNGMAVSSREPWRDEADLVQKRWAQAQACGPRWWRHFLTARNLACGKGGFCLETGAASDFRARTVSVRNDYQGSGTLGEMSAVCDVGERVCGCANGTNFEPLISVERAVLANPQDCS